AAGGAVEAVHEEHRAAELRAQAIGEEVAFAARQRAVVDHQAGGLVDDGEPRIHVQYLDHPCRRILFSDRAMFDVVWDVIPSAARDLLFPRADRRSLAALGMTSARSGIGWDQVPWCSRHSPRTTRTPLRFGMPLATLVQATNATPSTTASCGKPVARPSPPGRATSMRSYSVARSGLRRDSHSDWPPSSSRCHRIQACCASSATAT